MRCSLSHRPAAIAMLSALLWTAPVAHAAMLGADSDSAQERDSRTASVGDTAAPVEASTQTRPQKTPPRTSLPKPKDDLGVDLFAQFGSTSFTAAESFAAILGKSTGSTFGGGGQIRLPLNLFVRVDVSRLKEIGERVFVSNGEVFKLGIPTTITITPIEVTGGYRHELSFGGSSKGGSGLRLVPFGGAGVGRLQYQESADFAAADEDVDTNFTSYHVIGGVEVPIWRWLGTGVEYQHRWVRDAIGTGGVSAEFNEDDLGGGTFRVRLMLRF
jgi:opacity protein-like surface antigen